MNEEVTRSIWNSDKCRRANPQESIYAATMNREWSAEQRVLQVIVRVSVTIEYCHRTMKSDSKRAHRNVIQLRFSLIESGNTPRKGLFFNPKVHPSGL